MPGGILTVVGAILVSGRMVDEAMRWWPIVLVAIGALVIARAVVRPQR